MTKVELLAELLAELKKPSFEDISTEDMAIELYRRCRKGQTIKITDKCVKVTHSEYLDGLKSAQEVKVALSRYAL